MTTDTLAEIKTLDQQLAQLDKENRQFVEALGRARGMRATAADQSASLTAKRKRTIADMLLGLTRRASVDAVDAEIREAQQQREQAQRDQELAQLGEAEINERMQPVVQQIGPLRRHRQVLVRRAIREQAEAAGKRYREAIEAMGRAYAECEVYSAYLRQLEEVQGTDGGRQSFGFGLGPRRFNVAAFPELRAFSGLPLAQQSVVFRDFDQSTKTEIFIDAREIEQRVADRLASLGL